MDKRSRQTAVSSNPAKRTHAKKKRKKARFIVLCSFLGLMGCFILVAGILVQYFFGDLKTQKLTSNHEALGIAATAPQDKKVTNIALFGVDSAGSKIRGRSDAIIVLSIDNRHGKIKMSSFLRDSTVLIDDYGNDKITHAFAYGGPELAIRTLNKNFNLDIKEYVAVNFNSLADVINAVGGLDIKISEAERKEINRIMGFNQYGVKWKRVEKSGTVHLDGIQAMSYARIRKIDSDVFRAKRQQKVLNLIFEKCKDMKTTEYPGFIKKMIGLVETSLSYNDILSLSSVMLTPNLEVVSNTFPAQEDSLRSGYNERGAWCWFFDIDAATDRLHKFIYQDIYEKEEK